MLSSDHPVYFDFLATIQKPVCRAGVRGGLRLSSDSGGGSRLRCPQTRAQSQVVTVTVVISGQKHIKSTRELCSLTAISALGLSRAPMHNMSNWPFKGWTKYSKPIPTVEPEFTCPPKPIQFAILPFIKMMLRDLIYVCVLQVMKN